jgi:hypothetical protein
MDELNLENMSPNDIVLDLDDRIEAMDELNLENMSPNDVLDLDDRIEAMDR